MKTNILFTLLNFLVLWASAQNEFRVQYVYDASGNAHFSADNYTKVPVYVSLNFSFLENASFNEELPYIKRINPGTTQLFSIYREMDQPSPNFNIEVNWFNSHPSPEVDPEFPYLIPGRPGTRVICTDAVKNENSRSVGFEFIGTDEVLAARKGVVVGIVNNIDTGLTMGNPKQLNKVMILHEDGTIGEYFNFQLRKINCTIGQDILPGEFIGKAANLSVGRPYIGFSLFHSNLNSKKNIFLVPEFQAEGNKPGQLSKGQEYKVIHPLELIYKELNRKEKRNLKNK